jgi:hypothetical protein
MTGANGGGRRILRIVSVTVPAYDEAGVESGTMEIKLREPRVKDWLAAEKASDDRVRTFTLLAGMVLGEDGNPIGSEGVEDLPLSVLEALTSAVSAMMGAKDAASPLVPANASGTD